MRVLPFFLDISLFPKKVHSIKTTVKGAEARLSLLSYFQNILKALAG